MQTKMRFWTLFLAFSLSFSGIISCGGCGDEDSSAGSEQIDDDDTASSDDDESCYTCQTTPECNAAFGPGWACNEGCCVEIGDDDVDDDLNDDVNDDVDDDVDDDVNDDIDDDVNDDADDDVDDDINPPSCEAEQVNNGPLDVDNDGDGYAENIGDCNDDNNAVNPGMFEVFDGVDNNCDGIIDEVFDDDCDGYQSEESGGDDCDDNDYMVYPGTADNGLISKDLNCDGLVGDATSGDADGDGFAALGTSGGIVDCDDSDADAFPGALEFPDDGIDQDCNGIDLLPGNATGVFVALSGSNSNPGTMAAPKRTIIASIHLATIAGKSVFVAVGVYSEDVETEVSLFGGYESAGWTRDIGANVTTINAAESTAVKISGSNPVAIQGFTINDGTGSSYSYGVHNNSGTATLANNIIFGGSGSSSCGVYNHSGTATLVNNDINGGTGSSHCYGVRNYKGTATLVNNTINGGTESNYSYGVINDYGTATLVNNTINGGTGSGFSCGVSNDSDTATLVNNTIHGGSGSVRSYGVDTSGSAMLVNNTIDGGTGSEYSYGLNNYGTATLVNNTIDGGTGSEYSYGVRNYKGTATLVNNDIWGADMDCMIYYRDNSFDECQANTIVEVNACAWSGCVGVSGNISADPLFVNPTGEDFHLGDSSPCINTGIDPTYYIAPALVNFDFEGDARPYGAGWDIGADEWTP